MMSSEMKELEGWRIHQVRTEQRAKGLHYRRAVLEDEGAGYPVPKERELTAEKMVDCKAVCKRLTSFPESQRKGATRLEKRMEFLERPQAVSRIATRKYNSWRMKGRGSDSEKISETSNQELGRSTVSVLLKVRCVGAL